ncbi:MAG: SdpA family antimicrobial peptide system protein [Cumulibacter sp.]
MRQRQAGLVAAISVSLGALILSIAIFLGLPSNALSVRDGSTVRWLFSGFMPQGWAFFTKPPDDPEFHAYRVGDDGKIESASVYPNSRAENLFGISRLQRTQGPEMALLARAAKSKNWLDCLELPQGDDCLIAASQSDPIRLDSPTHIPTLCGRILIAETAPVPWPFRNDYTGWRIDQNVVNLEVRCDE